MLCNAADAPMRWEPALNWSRGFAARYPARVIVLHVQDQILCKILEIIPESGSLRSTALQTGGERICACVQGGSVLRGAQRPAPPAEPCRAAPDWADEPINLLPLIWSPGVDMSTSQRAADALPLTPNSFVSHFLNFFGKHEGLTDFVGEEYPLEADIQVRGLAANTSNHNGISGSLGGIFCFCAI